MLVVTRTAGQSVVIGDDTKVTILGVKGSQVRVGIEAPRDLGVYREEIYLRIQQERDKQADEAETA